MKSSPDPAAIAHIADLLSSAESALFITGAGISAESGLPTYRGIGGLYENAVTEEGVPIDVALSGSMLRKNPRLTWKYIHQLERACRGARFNRAHRILAELERRLSRVWVLTQNIDGLHSDAGSRNVIEIHGSVRRLGCMQCGDLREIRNYDGLESLPSCRHCNGLLRPDVVLFGEMLPELALERLYRELGTGFDLVFSIGTMSTFSYIAEPVISASRAGLPTIEINPGITEVSPYVSHRIPTGAVPALEALARAMRLSSSA